MYRIRCAEVWGGIKNEDLDVCSSVLKASLYSSACDGGKGGDVYFVSVCANDQLTRLAIADVVGHGERVAQVSTRLYDSLHARMNSIDGTEVLTDLNQSASEYGLKAMATAALAAVFSGDSSACFSYAGHHPVLIRRAGQTRWTPVPIEAESGSLANLPLGVEPATTYDQRSVPVQTGDHLFLYTDGVIEAPSVHGELFGQARLESVLEQVGDVSLPELKSAVLDELRKHAGGELTHDDVTLLAVEVL